MSGLLLSTLEMMGITFLIGFFVALVIKLIATAADSLDFYSSHQKELLRLRRLRKLRQKVELLMHDSPSGAMKIKEDGREDYSRGINPESTGYSGYYHGVSLGSSDMNLVDYYYPEDTHMVFLNEADAQRHNSKKQPKKATDNTK